MVIARVQSRRPHLAPAEPHAPGAPPDPITEVAPDPVGEACKEGEQLISKLDGVCKPTLTVAKSFDQSFDRGNFTMRKMVRVPVSPC